MKFQVGEIAVYVGLDGKGAKDNGMEVEIIKVGPFGRGEPFSDGVHKLDIHGTCDYEVLEPNGVYEFINEPYLRKRQPPDEQDYIPEQVRRLFGQPVHV